MNDEDTFENALRKLGSVILSVLAWISVFALSWLALSRVIPFDALSISFWMFFLLVALASGSTYQTRGKQSR